MAAAWTPPPEPPPLDSDTARALANHFEDYARHVLTGELQLVLGWGNHLPGVSSLLEAVQANLTAALVLRETYEVDLDRYDR